LPRRGVVVPATGTGSGQPTEFVTALAGTASEINGGGTEVLLAADAYTLQSALPPRFQRNSAWAANLAIINQFRQFETTNGSLKFPSLQNDPPTLLGKPMHEVSEMDGTIVITQTASNYVLVVGDWSQFLVVDRVGTRVEIVSHLLGTNRRLSGQRGFYAWFRTGSDVLVDNAFRLLDVPTTA
jgi:HK97 family phage major capsid protein